MSKSILRQLYFDYNSTTPVLPRIANKISEALLSNYGNPSSSHILGKSALNAIKNARVQVSKIIGSQPEEIIFTANATESNNLSVFGTITSKNHHFITPIVEHPAIIEPAKVLEKRGNKVTYLKVDSNGLVSLDEIKRSVTNETKLISVMLANNETGVLQNIAEIGDFARSNKIIFHTDASQAVTKVPINIKEMNVDLLTIAGHKMYAPKGIGALFIRKGLNIEPIMHGGGQENNIRSGTENVPYIVGLGEACEMGHEDLALERQRQISLGNQFANFLRTEIKNQFIINGEKVGRLPNTLNVSFKDIKADDLMQNLRKLNVFVSAGAACHEGSENMSHVLAAMNVPEEFGFGTIRFSWGRLTTEEDVTELGHRLKKALNTLD